MRYLTSAQDTQRTARGSAPVILIAFNQSVPGIVRAYKWSSRALNDDDTYTISAVEYDARLAAIPELEYSMPSSAGVATLGGGTIVIANPSKAGVLFSDAFDNGMPDGATVSFALVYITGSEATADLLQLFKARVTECSYDIATISLPYLDIAARLMSVPYPKERFELEDYANLPRNIWGTVRPVVWGDCTGKAFDFTTPASATWNHIPAPHIDYGAQTYFLRDIATASAQEEIIDAGGVLCTIPTASRTLSASQVVIDGNLTNAVIWPVRASVVTGVTNPSYAMDDDLTTYAVVGSGDTLTLDFPGLPDSLGAYGEDDTPADAAYSIYLIMSAASGTPNINYDVLLNGVVITGHENITVATSTATATTTITIGDHLTNGWPDTKSVQLRLESAAADVYIRRVFAAVQFRSNEIGVGLNDGQKVYRSQLGFTESAVAATDDYQDGGYIYPAGRTTTPLANPADVLEAQLRNKNVGLALRAPAWTTTSIALISAVGNGTTLWLTGGTIGSFAVGNTVLIDTELMYVSAVALVTASGPVEAGDASNQLSAWSFTGATTANTNGGTVYWNLTYADPVRTVSVYKDSAKTQLVASGGADADGVITLTAQGGSGLSGSVTVAYTTPDTDAPNTLKFYTDLTVNRGFLGSGLTCHNETALAYILGSGGDVNIGSFRAVAGRLRHETGAELLTNGEMEGTYTSGVAASWSETDADAKCTPTEVTGYARKSGQSLARTAGGANPYVSQGITTVAGTWYRLSAWVKGSVACTTYLSAVDSGLWTVAATTSWAKWVVEFKAVDTSTTIALYAPTTAATCIWDEVSVKALAEWEWAYADTQERDGRDAIDEAAQEAGIRITSDVDGRIAARILDTNRDASTRTAWGAAQIALSGKPGDPDRKPLISVRQSDEGAVVTGIIVKYGYDHIIQDYRGQTWVTCDRESTGQVLTGYNAGTDVGTVASTATIFPADRWDSGTPVDSAACDITISGTSVAITNATLQTNGVAAGDWFLYYGPGAGVTNMGVISSVDSQTAITLAEKFATAAPGVSQWYVAYPHLLLAGGTLYLPMVVDGQGSESATELPQLGAIWLDSLNFPQSAIPDPSVGDTIFRLISDSDDGAGTRDQHYTLRDNRERVTMRRVAIYGQTNNISVDAPRIRDRETAVAYRNWLFDDRQRRWYVNVTTDLSTIGNEIGDHITLTYDLVPGGIFLGEIVSQKVNLATCTIDYLLRGIV